MRCIFFSVSSLFSFCVGFTLRGLAQTAVWTQLPGAPSGTTPRFDNISFVDETNGFVARATGGIYKTTDGGKTFTLSRSSTAAYPGTTLTAHFRSIAFVSPTRGWAGNLGPGSYDATVTDTNILFETFDGGTNWTVKPGFPETGMKGLCAFHALDSQHIYGGGRVRGPAYFIKSVDGGTNWTVTNLTAAGVLGGIMDVHFKDPNNGFLVGMDTNAFNSCTAPYYHGAIARTTNGGLSWQVVASSDVDCAYFWKMAWPSANVGYVSLQQNNMTAAGNHIVYKTIDGGATWFANSVPFSTIGVSTFYSQGIGFVNEFEGWVGGDSATGLANYLHTTDGGASWTPVGSDATLRINHIKFIRPDYAVASGARVAVWRVPLAITSSPTNRTIAIGNSTTFNVAAQGSTSLSYQWRMNGTNLPGAITSALTIANAQAANIGSYDVIVTDISGSVTSSPATTLNITGVPIAPSITSQPQNLVINVGATASFTVKAIGTEPLAYQWRLNGSPIAGATNATFTQTNAQLSHGGDYTVRITNLANSVTSEAARLSFTYQDSFDTFATPVAVTNIGTTNGYKIFFNAVAGPVDFKVIFGFDYANVTYPTTIPSAPHSDGGTTKALYLTVNKDANGQISAVNLYPTNSALGGNYALKFDLWMNWANLGSSTEHILFGINHSGNVTNRIGLATSDGLFFAISADGNVLSTGTTLRDYAVYRGGGPGAIPIFMTTDNTLFGPAPLLGANFDNLSAGISSLFPPKTFAGWGTTPAGSIGLGWVAVEVRQVNDLITCLLNGTALAQYVNPSSYTSGSIMLGYYDGFASIGDTNSFALIDNLRVEGITIAPVQILAPAVSSNTFHFSFATEAYERYSVQGTSDLANPTWTTYTTVLGNGNTMEVALPLNGNQPGYFRVSRP